MLAITYAWTWGWWFTTFAWFQEPAALRLALFVLGSFGPAVGGILTLRWRDTSPREGAMPIGGFAVGAGLATLAFLCFIFDVQGVTQTAAHILSVPDDTPAWAYAAMALPVAVSGWVFASVQSRNGTLRHWFQKLVPDARALMLAIPILLFLPVLFIVSDLVARVIGMEYNTPRFLTDPVSLWLPLMIVKLFTVFMLTGGNEEHGWRGVLQPIMQRSMSPLLVSLIIGVVWELWHLPLVLNDIYGDGPVLQILISRMLVVVPLAFLFTALWNYSRGSIFLCILLHACMNTQPAIFAGSELAGIMAFLVLIVLIVGHKMWRKGTGYDPEGV